MLGWQRASRYYDSTATAMPMLWSVKGLKRVREEMGLTNVIPLILCQTPDEKIVGC